MKQPPVSGLAAVLLSVGLAVAQDSGLNPREGDPEAIYAGRAMYQARCAEARSLSPAIGVNRLNERDLNDLLLDLGAQRGPEGNRPN
jgi:hypothetical protein